MNSASSVSTADAAKYAVGQCTVRQLIPLLLCGLVAASGCGKAGPTMVKIKGTIEYKGEPLHSGMITFNPKNPQEGHVAQAEISEDGTFVLSTFKAGDGAEVGDYIISATSIVDGTEVLEKDKGLGIGGKSVIPERYGDPKTSKLEQSVEVGDEKEDLVIELE